MDEVTAKEESLGQRESRVRQAFYSSVAQPEENSSDLWVREVFEDYLILETPAGLLKYSYSDTADGIVFADPVDVEQAFVNKGKLDRIVSMVKSCFAMLPSAASRPYFPPDGIETQSILTKDVDLKICSTDERLVGGLVLIPGEVDSQNDYWRAKDIRKVSLGFMEKSQVIDYMHTSLPVANVVESMYFPTPEEGGQEKYSLYGHEAPAGAWWITVKVYDDDAWKQVRSGQLTGFSIFGIKRASKSAASKSAGKATDDHAGARLMDGDDWDVTMVALVDHPAVSQATYYVVKRDENGKNQIIDYRGRKISDETYGKLKAAYASIADLLTLADEERRLETIPWKPEKEARETMDKPEVKDEETQKAEVTAGIAEGQADAGADPMEAVQKALEEMKAQIEALTLKVGEVALKAEEEPRLPDEVAKRIDDLDNLINAIARKSNAISTDGGVEIVANGMPAWANPTGGARKQASK